MIEKIEKFFDIKTRGSSVGIEAVAGLTTFMTMAYIIFLQPTIMTGQTTGIKTGMDFGALLTGVCIAAAFGSILMGLLANYPVALAPGMGENFFFVLTVFPFCAALPGYSGEPWRLALGVVFMSGIIFLILSFFRIRQILLKAISPNLTKAITAGIGVFIALLGLQNGGLIVSQGGHYALVNNLEKSSAFIPVLIFVAGLIATAALHILKTRGSILWGILAGAIVATITGQLHFDSFPVSLPPDIGPVFAKADIAGVFNNFLKLLPFIVVFAFMDVFDTLGTLIGVCTEAKLMKGNDLPNSTKAFAADATATVFGSVCGHSTVTSFIESATGVEHGGRTGLTAVFTGICFILAAFLAPLITTIAQCSAVTAPALVVVGAMMMKNVKDIDWDDYSEAIPSFLIFAGIPFTYSIADGLTLGFISYPLIKLFSGKARETGWLNYILALLLVLYLYFVRSLV